MKKAVCVMLALCLTLLCGCVPSAEFLRKQEQGYYPTAADHPDTEWVCREIDLCLYMFDYDEDYLMGTYTVDGASYRVISRFDCDLLEFQIISSTEISPSDASDSMVHCEQISYGFIISNYILDKGTGSIVCDIYNYELSGKETFPQTLTFEKVGSIAKEPITRWYAQEIDMYLDAFSDIDDYFRGEIVIDGKKCFVHALEIGNGGYFSLFFENGKTNDLIAGTTSKLIDMHFEIKDDQIIAKLSDEYLSNKVAFPEWPYDDMIITFKTVPPEK